MSDNTVAETLICMFANQSRRWREALADLPEEIFDRSPGGDCKSIRHIGGHLVHLYAFQMKLLGESNEDMPKGDSLNTVAELIADMDAAEKRVIDAIGRHDAEDWFAVPEVEREGPWGDEPTLTRFTRPFNDLTNHLGGIRAIRRILGSPALQTQ